MPRQIAWLLGLASVLPTAGLARSGELAPVGTWHLNAGGARLTVVVSADGDRLRATIAEGDGAPEPLEEVAWSGKDSSLTFRRKLKDTRQWFRATVAEGVLSGRFSEGGGAHDRPGPISAYTEHMTGWNADVFDRDAFPRVYEVLIGEKQRARLRIDRSAEGAAPIAGRLKVYSTTDKGARGEELEHDLQVTRWGAKEVRFLRHAEGGDEEFLGSLEGRSIKGTLRRAGSSATLPWRGTRAEVLGFGLTPKSPEERAAWQEKTRRRLFLLMMAGNPAPLSRVVQGEGREGSEEKDRPPFASSKYPPHRDDDPARWPQAYRLRELHFEHTLRDPHGGPPLVRRSHGYLAVPTTTPPASGKYPAVLAVNGHGGSAWQMMQPESEYFWYGDAFARRGFVVLALDISHRPAEDRRGLYRGADDGDDPEHANHAHPAIRSPGLDSDWEEDGERAWDAMRGADYLFSLPEVDHARLLVTGLSMGGEVTSFAAALDPRFVLGIPSGYSPDMGVMTHYGNHECWR